MPKAYGYAVPSGVKYKRLSDGQLSYNPAMWVSNSAMTSGWITSTTNSSELISVQTDHVSHQVGGYTGDTHYSRVVRQLPVQDDTYIDCAAPSGRFTLRCKFWLPSDFYTQHESYVRFVTVDNYPLAMKTGGAIVGASNENEWRVFFGIESVTYKIPKLGVHHETQEEMTLWTPASDNANRLPTGFNEVFIDFTPNTPGATDGAWSITVNGTQMGSATGVRTMPGATLANSERKLTNIYAGLDGAYAQDTKTLTSRTYSVQLTHVAG